VFSSNDIDASCGNLSTDVKELIPHRMWNHFRVPKTPINPRARLAKNIKALMAMQELTAYQVAEAAKVDPKTVYNLLNQGFDPRLSRVEKVANAFGLTTWQLLAHDWELRPANSKLVTELLERYSSADDAGRAAIMQVAGIASQKASE
jgi:transcriptional regulator with XRE-family HTH domain